MLRSNLFRVLHGVCQHARRNVVYLAIHQFRGGSRNYQERLNWKYLGFVGGFALLKVAKCDDRKLKAVIEKADILYQNYLIENVYNGLKRFESYDNPEILWRLARATCELAKQCPEKPRRQELMEEGFDYISRALNLQPPEGIFAVHKWYAILLNYMGDYQGTKEMIKNSVLIKEHLEKALKINPTDPTTLNILGTWHYEVADLPFYKRTLASAVFATPPTSSYEEALKYFEEAEKLSPNFYSLNLLMLAKCHIKLGSKQKAKPFLEAILERVLVTPDDYKAMEEATGLLGSL